MDYDEKKKLKMAELYEMKGYKYKMNIVSVTFIWFPGNNECPRKITTMPWFQTKTPHRNSHRSKSHILDAT